MDDRPPKTSADDLIAAQRTVEEMAERMDQAPPAAAAATASTRADLRRLVDVVAVLCRQGLALLADLGMSTPSAAAPTACPTCKSPDPRRHPARRQFTPIGPPIFATTGKDDVIVCADLFHAAGDAPGDADDVVPLLRAELAQVVAQPYLPRIWADGNGRLVVTTQGAVEARHMVALLQAARETEEGQARLLNQVAEAVYGPPEPGRSHGWAALPQEVALRLRVGKEAAQQLAKQVQPHPDAPAKCPCCQWTNGRLMNYGAPGTPRWLCHSCAAEAMRPQCSRTGCHEPAGGAPSGVCLDHERTADTRARVGHASAPAGGTRIPEDVTSIMSLLDDLTSRMARMDVMDAYDEGYHDAIRTIRDAMGLAKVRPVVDERPAPPSPNGPTAPVTMRLRAVDFEVLAKAVDRCLAGDRNLWLAPLWATLEQLRQRFAIVAALRQRELLEAQNAAAAARPPGVSAGWPRTRAAMTEFAREHGVVVEGDDARVWRERAEALWDLLDQIDTLSDVLKEPPAHFQVEALGIARRRGEVLASDGQRLYPPGERGSDPAVRS